MPLARGIPARGSRPAAALFAAALVALTLPSTARAQGVTTGAIGGRVSDSSSSTALEHAQIQVLNPRTGYSVGTLSRADGRYLVSGVEIGGPYTVSVRLIGFKPQTRNDVYVTLSQTATVGFALVPQVVQLTGVQVQAEQDPTFSVSHTGTLTTVSDSMISRLPSLNRNFTDFVALTPQVSTTLPNGGLSGAGVNNRFNQVQIDGAAETDLFGIGSTGQPGGQASGKSIAIESVKEYQVLLSPFDVRQGNFAGLLVNAVTKHGTNDFHGSAYSFGRNQSISRSQDYITDYKQYQYGFSVGGPIVHDKVQFFVNPEWQSRTSPAAGLYLNGPGSGVSAASVDSLSTILSGYGLNAGSPGLINNQNPLSNLFGRVDVQGLPFNSTLVLRYNYGLATNDIFSRGTGGSQPSFPLGSNGYKFKSTKNAPVLQLRSTFANGGYNELILGLNSIRDRRTPNEKTPMISVTTPTAFLVAGGERFSHGNELDQDINELTDNYTYPIGTHTVTVGTQNSFYKVRNLFAQSIFGVWDFNSLDSLANGQARQYIVGVPVSGDGAVRFKAQTFALYGQDVWAVTPAFHFTYGMRIDVPRFAEKPPFNAAVDSIYGRNTADIPSGRMQYSPRLGFNWDMGGTTQQQLRGGFGVFVGHPAYVWLSNAFQNSGLSGVALLTCNNAAAPAFNAANIATPPTACTNGTTAALGSEIDLLQHDLRFPQTARTSLGYDRDLGWQNVTLTLEGLYTKAMYAPFYQNIALSGPQGTDAFGRVMYGPRPNAPVLVSAARNTVLDVSNENKDHSFNFTTTFHRRFIDNWEASASYSYTTAVDVMSLTSSTAFSNYRFGRTVSGAENELSPSTSSFQQKHRFIVSGTYTFQKTKTTLSSTYIGASGTPVTFIANQDLNGDGVTLNDAIPVPKDAADANEIQFKDLTAGGVTYTAAQQAAAFNQFIDSNDCLKSQRGKVMKRNSCSAPWQNEVDISIRQELPRMRNTPVALQLDIINSGNLVNKDWGRQQSTFGQLSVLNYTGNTGGATGTLYKQDGNVPIYQYNPTTKLYNFDQLTSNYQMQLGLRVSF